MQRVVDSAPLAPWEPDEADAGPLLPLELLGWDASGHLVGLRCTDTDVVLRNGRPAVRRPLRVVRLTRWARAGRVTLHCTDDDDESEHDVEVRLLDPQEYAGLSVGDPRPVRVAGPVRVARSGQRSSRRDDVVQTLVGRLARACPGLQVFTG